jgi:hypothetical protein
MKEWGVSRQLSPDEANRIKGRIIVLFYECACSDTNILRMLAADGDKISKYKLYRLRKELGIYRRVSGPEEQVAVDEAIFRFVTSELLTGAIDGFGKNYCFLQARTSGFAFARDSLFSMVKELNPDGVRRRSKDAQRRKGEYIVPGPNWLWSIDGHEKLKPYGFEIYAAIDAYSRKVICIYVGISAGTAVSVGNQYLRCVKKIKRHPRFIRSDCGKETFILAYTHLNFSQDHDPDSVFGNCYMYGTSTANQRIESWWQQMSKGLLFRWRVRRLIPGLIPGLIPRLILYRHSSGGFKITASTQS